MTAKNISDILSWINDHNSKIKTTIEKINFDSCKPWFYDQESGRIRNTDGSFFQISGVRFSESIEQPLYLQNEIAF